MSNIYLKKWYKNASCLQHLDFLIYDQRNKYLWYNIKRAYGSVNKSNNSVETPDDIKDKIFQPFFTTKPTGEGTGLGLSLAYDIVKAHGGELTVAVTESEGTQFNISLPLN